MIMSDQPLPQEVTEEEVEITEKVMIDQREEMEKEEASEVEVKEEEEEEEVVIEEVEEVTEVEVEKEVEEAEVVLDHKPLSDLMPMETQSNNKTEEEEEIEEKVTKTPNTVDTTEETEPVEEIEEVPREELVNSTREKDQRPNTNRRVLKMLKLLKTQLLKKPRSKPSQLSNTRKSYTVFLSMTTSLKERLLEPRKPELPKVSAKTLRSKPTLRLRSTIRSPLPRTLTDIPLTVNQSSMPQLLWVSKP